MAQKANRQQDVNNTYAMLAMNKTMNTTLGSDHEERISQDFYRYYTSHTVDMFPQTTRSRYQKTLDLFPRTYKHSPKNTQYDILSLWHSPLTN